MSVCNYVQFYFVGVVGDDVQLSEPLVGDERFQSVISTFIVVVC